MRPFYIFVTIKRIITRSNSGNATMTDRDPPTITAIMSTTPEDTSEFYDDRGAYRTVYEDRTTAVARTRPQVERFLLRRPMSDLIIDSTFSVPCGGSPDCLLVIVTGNDWFKQVFIAEYRPERPQTYAIAVSLPQRIFAGPAADQLTVVTTFNAGDGHADTGADHRQPTAGLKVAERVNFSPNKAPYLEPLPDNTRPDPTTENSPIIIVKHIPDLTKIATPLEPLPDTVTDDDQPDIVNESPPVIILECIPDLTEIATPPELLPDTVTNNKSIGGLQEKKRVTFSPNIATYKEYDPDTVIDNSQPNITVTKNTDQGFSFKNWPIRMFKKFKNSLHLTKKR